MSPDINPIENLWGIMVWHVYADGKQYDNCNELTAAVMHAWAAIDESLLHKLVTSMHNRCVQLLMNGGGKIDF